MSEMRFEVTGRNKADIDRAAKAVIQRFMGEPADPIDLTICVRPALSLTETRSLDSTDPLDEYDSWEATVHYEW